MTNCYSLENYQKIESLQTNLRESHAAISHKDDEIIALQQHFHQELANVNSEFQKLRVQYDLLLSNHHKLSKLNHELEARLLEVIETRNTNDKSLSEELEKANNRQAECERALLSVIAERDRYKADCAVAVNLLRANPNHFMLSSTKTPISPTSALRGEDIPEGGDCSQPTLGSPFPSFLPTFPPIGLPSMLNYQKSNTMLPSHPALDTADLSEQQPSQLLTQHSNGYSSTIRGKSVVTDL